MGRKSRWVRNGHRANIQKFLEWAAANNYIVMDFEVGEIIRLYYEEKIGPQEATRIQNQDPSSNAVGALK